MPLGIVWLVVGIVIGSVAGWLLFDQLLVGAAAGFAIVLVIVGAELNKSICKARFN